MIKNNGFKGLVEKDKKSMEEVRGIYDNISDLRKKAETKVLSYVIDNVTPRAFVKYSDVIVSDYISNETLRNMIDIYRANAEQDYTLEESINNLEELYKNM